MEDFTDQEAIAAILWITSGNMRLIHRLLMQIERILLINETRTVTKEVVESAAAESATARPPVHDIVGEFGFHAQNTTNPCSKRA